MPISFERLGCALLIVTGAACAAAVGCGSSSDDSGGSGSDAGSDATASHGGSVDSGEPGDTGVAPIDGAGDDDGSNEASVDSGPAPIICPTAPPADFADAAVAAACSQLVYMAGGDATRILASSDGVTWTTQQFDVIGGDDYVNNIAVFRATAMATALAGVYQSKDPTGGLPISSEDAGADAGDAGVTFSPVTAITTGGFDTYGGQFNVGDNGTLFTDGEGTYFTTDGLAWTRLSPYPGMPSKDGFGGHWSGTAYGAGIYVALQDNGKFRTYDGTTFTDGTIPFTTTNGSTIAYGSGIFAAISAAGQVTTSTDGITWTAATTIPSMSDGGGSLSGAHAILFDGTHFLAYSNNEVAISTDAKAWTASALSMTQIGAVAVQEGHFLAVGSSAGTSGILLSSDGTTWTLAHAFTSEEKATQNGWRVGLGRVLK